MKCSLLRRGSSKASKSYTITVTGTGYKPIYKNHMYVLINGLAVYSAGTYKLEEGKRISLYGATSSYDSGETSSFVKINGTTVVEEAARNGKDIAYSFIPTSDTTIKLQAGTGYNTAMEYCVMSTRFTVTSSTNPLTYTIVFNGAGGTPSSSSLTTGYDFKLSSLPTVTRDGYNFVGWFTSPTGGNQITTSTIFSGDTNVYAQWVEKPKKATIKVSGTGNASYCYLTINGSKVTGAGTYEVSIGDTITCAMRGRTTSASSRVTLNGTQVKSGSGTAGVTYTYTVTTDATITLRYASSSNTIQIVE